jgi:DNA repair exonuclease SbcCD nuclease subunit
MVYRLLSWFQQLFYKNIDVFIIPGNHDISNCGNALDYLAFRNSLYVFREPTIVELKDHKLGFLPYSRTKFENSSDWNPEIIFYHGLIESAQISKFFRFTTGDEVLSKDSVSKLMGDCKYFIAGDVHLHQRIETGDDKWIGYVGTPWQHNFGEEGYDTGYLVIEDGNLVHLGTLGTTHLTRSVSSLEEGQRVLSQVKDSPNPIRLRFQVSETLGLAERKILKRLGGDYEIDVCFKEEVEYADKIPVVNKEVTIDELLPIFGTWLDVATSDKGMKEMAMERAKELI